MSKTSDMLFDPSYDLSLPAKGGKCYKPHKKDHRCPHDRKDATGMELCRACGDFANCTICGDEFIKRDLGGITCQPCREIPQMRMRLDRAIDAQAQRKAKYLPKPAHETVESERRR